MRFDEYMQLFGNDREKRQTAVEWFIETYPNQANQFIINNTQSWKIN